MLSLLNGNEILLHQEKNIILNTIMSPSVNLAFFVFFDHFNLKLTLNIVYPIFHVSAQRLIF